jgi:plasmid stabilization system protein ParE
MATDVDFHPLAAKEYRAARAWYAERSISASQRFRDQVQRTIERIADNPNLGAPFRWNCRWLRVRRFPYLIYFELTASNQVRVYAVAHSRRRLGYWVRRRHG